MVTAPWSRVRSSLKAAWSHHDERVDAASVAVFRVVTGALISLTALKILQGEIDLWMLESEMRMTYYGFSWVGPWPGTWGPAAHLSILAVVAALFALGVAYRVTSVMLFVLFTQLFLIEKSLYLNHFYLVSLVCLVFVFVRADRRFSLLRRRDADADRTVPRLAIWVFRLQFFIVYFYAGLMKLNSDWLAGAPVDLWFADIGDKSVFGSLLLLPFAPRAIAWLGAIFDLAAPIFLLTRFRLWAFGAALVFHGINHFVWDIGMFPFFATAATTLFFAPDWPVQILRKLGIGIDKSIADDAEPRPLSASVRWLALLFCIWQLLFPFRFLLYPGQVRWTAQGANFAWRMKLDDRRGFALFVVEDKATGKRQTFHPQNHLTYWQVWKMPEDPEMALQFAHHLRDKAKAKGRDVAVYAHMFVSLNGRERQMYIVPTRDLAQVERSLWPKDWIVPLVTPLRDATPSDFSGLEEPP